MRIKKIAERRTIWGGGRLRRKRGAEDQFIEGAAGAAAEAAPQDQGRARRARPVGVRARPARQDQAEQQVPRVGRAALPAPGGARGRRAPLVVHDGALRAQPSFYDLPSLPFPPADIRDMTNLERRLIDDDDGAAPASHYSTIASHRDLRRCHDGGTARPRSPRARPTSSLRERPGRVRSCSSSPLDLTSGGPARGLHAPPGPNGLLRGRHVPPALFTPTSSSYLPRVSFPLLPSAHKEL